MILLILAVLFGAAAFVAAGNGDWFAMWTGIVMVLILGLSFVLRKLGARPDSSGQKFWAGLGGGWKKEK